MTLSKNDFVSVPGHGIGTINGIEARPILGKDFYSIRLRSGMVMLWPVESLNSPDSIRTLSDRETAKKAIERAQDAYVADSTTWNVRYREYMSRIKIGGLFDYAYVFSNLNGKSKVVNLCYGEKKILHNALQLLVDEISIVLEMEVKYLRQLLWNDSDIRRIK